MSRGIVSQEEGEDYRMELLFHEKSRLVRYSWRGVEWSSEMRSTVINFEIVDLGVSRGNTGEGIVLNIIHDGWEDLNLREKQDRIWSVALRCLKDLLEERDYRVWWQEIRTPDGFRSADSSDVERFLRKIENESRGKQEKKAAALVMREIMKWMEGQGSWFIKGNESEVEFRFQKNRIFTMLKSGNVMMSWRELEKILTDRLQDFATRLSVEQDLDIHIGKSQDRFSATGLNPEFFSRWCIDVIQFKRDTL